MIDTITDAYVRHYSDNGQTRAYVEWIDHVGRKGRTEGNVRSAYLGSDGLPKANAATMAQVYGPHMGALLARALCHGVEIRRERW